MNQVTRRGFFGRVLAAAAAAVGVSRLTSPPVGLMAIRKHWDVRDPELGISIRFIKQWDIESHRLNFTAEEARHWDAAIAQQRKGSIYRT